MLPSKTVSSNLGNMSATNNFIFASRNSAPLSLSSDSRGCKLVGASIATGLNLFTFFKGSCSKAGQGRDTRI